MDRVARLRRRARQADRAPRARGPARWRPPDRHTAARRPTHCAAFAAGRPRARCRLRLRRHDAGSRRPMLGGAVHGPHVERAASGRGPRRGDEVRPRPSQSPSKSAATIRRPRARSISRSRSSRWPTRPIRKRASPPSRRGSRRPAGWPSPTTCPKRERAARATSRYSSRAGACPSSRALPSSSRRSRAAASRSSRTAT